MRCDDIDNCKVLIILVLDLSAGEAMEEYRRWARDSSLSVTSSSNARVKAAKQLHSSNGRKKTGLVLLEGLRLCCDALEASFAEDSTVPAPTSVLVDPTAFESPEGARLEAALQVHLIFGPSHSCCVCFVFRSIPCVLRPFTVVTHLRFPFFCSSGCRGEP